MNSRRNNYWRIITYFALSFNDNNRRRKQYNNNNNNENRKDDYALKVKGRSEQVGF